MDPRHQWILTEFAARLNEMNRGHRRMALPAVNAASVTTQKRLEHLRALVDALDHRQVDEALIVDIGAHALAWLDVLRSTPPTAPEGDPEFAPIPPAA